MKTRRVIRAFHKRRGPRIGGDREQGPEDCRRSSTRQFSSPVENQKQAIDAHDIDIETEIKRLAALGPVVYERARVDTAKRLGVRANVLDRAVAKVRESIGLESDRDGQGRAVKIADVLPWYEPVDGDRIATTLAAAVKPYAVLPTPQPTLLRYGSC